MVEWSPPGWKAMTTRRNVTGFRFISLCWNESANYQKRNREKQSRTVCSAPCNESSARLGPSEGDYANDLGLLVQHSPDDRLLSRNLNQPVGVAFQGIDFFAHDERELRAQLPAKLGALSRSQVRMHRMFQATGVVRDNANKHLLRRWIVESGSLGAREQWIINGSQEE